jgi:hypothetical protein
MPDSAQDTVDQLLLTVLLRTVAKADALVETQEQPRLQQTHLEQMVSVDLILGELPVIPMVHMADVAPSTGKSCILSLVLLSHPLGISPYTRL